MIKYKKRLIQCLTNIVTYLKLNKMKKKDLKNKLKTRYKKLEH